jgi:hypothetical protein
VAENFVTSLEPKLPLLLLPLVYPSLIRSGLALRYLPSPYAAPIQRNRWRFMSGVMVFADCRFSESQPIFNFVPFVVGIAKPISLTTTRTLYRQLVFEGIGYSGRAVLNSCDAYGHFFLLPGCRPVFRNPLGFRCPFAQRQAAI